MGAASIERRRRAVGEKVRKVGEISAQSDIACDCQKENPPFVQRKRKPGFIIKFLHRRPKNFSGSPFDNRLIIIQKAWQSQENKRFLDTSAYYRGGYAR